MADPSHNAMVAEWLDRLWTFAWGSVVLTTGLLIAGLLDGGQWLTVFQLTFAGFTSVRLVEAAGEAWAKGKGS